MDWIGKRWPAERYAKVAAPLLAPDGPMVGGRLIIVGVFGPSDNKRRRPWTGIAVRGPRTLDEYKELDPRLNQHIQHMMDLPADRVLKKTLKMLAEMVE